MSGLPSFPPQSNAQAGKSLRNSSQVIQKAEASYSYNRMKRIVSINSLAVPPTTSSICLHLPVSTLSNEALQLLLVRAAQLENPKQTAEQLPASFPEPHHCSVLIHPYPFSQVGGLPASHILLFNHCSATLTRAGRQAPLPLLKNHFPVTCVCSGAILSTPSTRLKLVFPRHWCSWGRLCSQTLQH